MIQQSYCGIPAREAKDHTVTIGASLLDLMANMKVSPETTPASFIKGNFTNPILEVMENASGELLHLRVVTTEYPCGLTILRNGRPTVDYYCWKAWVTGVTKK